MKRCGRSKIGPQALVIVIARESESGGRGGSAGGVEIILHVLAVLGGEVGGGLYVRVGLDDFLGRRRERAGCGDLRCEQIKQRIRDGICNAFGRGQRCFEGGCLSPSDACTLLMPLGMRRNAPRDNG